MLEHTGLVAWSRPSVHPLAKSGMPQTKQKHKRLKYLMAVERMECETHGSAPYTHPKQSVNWASHCNYLPYSMTLLLIMGQETRSQGTKQNGILAGLLFWSLFCFWDRVLPFSPGWLSTHCVFQTVLWSQDYRLVSPRLKTCRCSAIIDTGDSVYSGISLWNWAWCFGIDD